MKITIEWKHIKLISHIEYDFFLKYFDLFYFSFLFYFINSSFIQNMRFIAHINEQIKLLLCLKFSVYTFCVKAIILDPWTLYLNCTMDKAVLHLFILTLDWKKSKFKKYSTFVSNWIYTHSERIRNMWMKFTSSTEYLF